MTFKKYDYSQGACRGCEVPKTEVTGPEHWRELNERCDQCGARVEREKLVELLWEFDQMRMMRMSIEECVDRLIPKGVTVQECCHKAESAISKTGLMCTACYSDIDRDAVFCKYCGAKVMPQPPKGE